MTRDSMRDRLVDLAERLGMEPLVPDPRGVCALRIDGVLIGLRADEAKQSIVLFADLGPIARGSLGHADLLRSNLLWRATHGSTLSLTSDDPPHVVLAKPHEWWLGADLADELDAFVGVVATWTKYVSGEDPLRMAEDGLDDASIDARWLAHWRA